MINKEDYSKCNHNDTKKYYGTNTKKNHKVIQITVIMTGTIKKIPTAITIEVIIMIRSKNR